MSKGGTSVGYSNCDVIGKDDDKTCKKTEGCCVYKNPEQSETTCRSKGDCANLFNAYCAS